MTTTDQAQWLFDNKIFTRTSLGRRLGCTYVTIKNRMRGRDSAGNPSTWRQWESEKIKSLYDAARTLSGES